MRRLFAFNEDDLLLLKNEWEFFFDRANICEGVVRDFFSQKTSLFREIAVDALTQVTVKTIKSAFSNPSAISKSAKTKAYLASKIGFNELMCKELGYAIADVYCKGLTDKYDLVARKTFGKLIAEFERGVYEIARRKSEKGIALLDRKTFDAYNDMLSHNVANAMTAINSYQTTLAKLVNRGKYEEAREFIKSSAEARIESFKRINELMEQNRRMATEGMGVPIFSAIFLIDRVIADLLISQAKIASTYSFSDPSAIIKGDDLSFIRAIYPVCINAIEAGANKIGIGLDIDSAAGIARVTIKNNGAPISEKDARRLFSPFFGRRDRLGYGLSYAKRHAENMSLLELDPPEFELTFKLL
jgi:hypothetical protein